MTVGMSARSSAGRARLPNVNMNVDGGAGFCSVRKSCYANSLAEPWCIV
jgi:hypothetical protein